jgi:hypothetical protein
MDRDIRVLTLAALAATILTPVMAAAQGPPQSQAPIAPKSEVIDPHICAPTDTRSTVGQGGNLQVQGQNGGNLSGQLAQSNDVIGPPDRVDPDIKQPTPQGGPMPVIPPPGSPGGDPNVHPK